LCVALWGVGAGSALKRLKSKVNILTVTVRLQSYQLDTLYYV